MNTNIELELPAEVEYDYNEDTTALELRTAYVVVKGRRVDILDLLQPYQVTLLEVQAMRDAQRIIRQRRADDCGSRILGDFNRGLAIL